MAGQLGGALGEDLESIDITSCKERIAQLQGDKERRAEYTERLQDRLKSLNGELAFCREEADRRRRQLDAEQAKNKALAESLREQREAGSQDHGILALVLGGDERKKGDVQERQKEQARRFIEEQLAEKVQKRSKRNDKGFRMFDEMELMVEKPAEEQTREGAYIDTVLITYSVPRSEQKYCLSYRVGRLMTSKKLREDACLYWDVSEVEFILKTLDGSKVQDDLIVQNIFRHNEEAHLLLTEKTPRSSGILEEQWKAIRPRFGKRTGAREAKPPAEAAQNAEGQARTGAAHGASAEQFYEQMAGVAGLYAFMTQRDQHVVAHLKRIKPRNILIYLILTVATVISIVAAIPPDIQYEVQYSVYTSMTEERLDPTSGIRVSEYTAIRSHREAWEWLSHTVANQLLVGQSDLRDGNFVPGWLAIRMQQVKPRSRDTCPDKSDVPADAACLAEDYDEGTAGTEDLDAVRLYWEQGAAGPLAGLAGRSNSTGPWKFVQANAWEERTGAGTGSGSYQNFDASGYVAEYDLQHQPLVETYQAYISDMAALRTAGWISDRTRAVHVNFAVYNGNWDYWISNWYLLEMPTSGLVRPSSEVRVYRPNTMDFGMGKSLLILDVGRLVLVLYVLTLQIYWEFSFERRTTSKPWLYFLGSAGISDLAIGGVFIGVFLIRYLVFGAIADDTVAVMRASGTMFTSMEQDAYAYHQISVLDSVLLGLLCFRLLGFLQINRHIYLLWATSREAVWAYSCYILVFVPVMLGFVVLGHAIWHAELMQYKTFWASFTSTLMVLFGDTSAPRVSVASRPWTLTYYTAFYTVFVLVFMNGWIAVLVQMYHRIRIAAGFRPKDYAWGEFQYASWLLYRPFLGFYVKVIRRGRVKLPGGEGEDE